jgi:hypothetical protein
VIRCEPYSSLPILANRFGAVAVHAAGQLALPPFRHSVRLAHGEDHGRLEDHLDLALPGLTLTIGALAGIAAFAEGMLITSPTAKKMQALAQAGGPFAPAKLAEMGQLRARVESAGTRGTYLLIVAVISMAIGG